MPKELSKTRQRVVDLYRAGTKPSVIAATVGINVAGVYVHLNRARRDGVDLPMHFNAGTVPLPLKMRVPAEVHATLDAEAQARGIGVPTLCEVLLKTIALDDLFTAVIDDIGGAA